MSSEWSQEARENSFKRNNLELKLKNKKKKVDEWKGYQVRRGRGSEEEHILSFFTALDAASQLKWTGSIYTWS